MSLRKGDKMIAGAVTRQSIQEMFFPVGSIVMGDNLIDEKTVKSIYGGTTWTKITGALYGIGDQVTTLGTVDEQAPNITATLGMRPFADSGDKIRDNFWASGSMSKSTQSTIDYYTFTARSAPSGITNQRNSISFDASRSSSVYTDGGHVLAKGTSTYAWKRTA